MKTLNLTMFMLLAGCPVTTTETPAPVLETTPVETVETDVDSDSSNVLTIDVVAPPTTPVIENAPVATPAP